MRVAIVHDWLMGGGAERVVEELHKIYPDAPIYTSYCTPEWRAKLDGKVVTGWLQPLGKIRKYIPVLRIWWFTHLDFSGYDLVISSSGNGEAFGVKVPTGTVHINYCHAPTHYYWRFYEQYVENPGFGFFNPLARLGLKLLIKPLRSWDYKAAQRPDYFIANSSHIQAEIKEFYGRDATVIFPPVNVSRFMKVSAKKRTGLVTASRQVSQKKLDIIIGAANELQLPLLVIGRGPEHDKLVRMAGKTVQFRDDVSDEEMPELFASSSAFLFAAYEDFGVTPVEALSAGTPVLAYMKGGALDYVKPGVNGEFFDVQSVPSLCAALQEFDPAKYSEAAVRQSAQQFSSATFCEDMKKFVDSCTKRKS